MEGVRQDDPFSWGVEAVAESLCSLKRPCTLDQAAFADKIRQEGIDGHTLLTFEFVCSRPELFDCLGIKLGAHKASLGREILSLRARSPAFRRWKLEFAKEQSEDVALAAPEVSATEIPVRTPKKQKRLAPMQLISPPANVPDSFKPAKAHGVVDPAPAGQAPETLHGFAWDRPVPHAYLGGGVMSLSAFKSSTPLTSQILEDQDTFATPIPVLLPAGLRRTAARFMKRHLLERSRKETLLRQGLHDMASSESSEADEVLELFDLPESFDDETLREIEEEEAEAAQEEALGNQNVKSERVRALLQEAVDGFKERWENVKLPKHQRTAYSIWTRARKSGTKTQQVFKARQLAKALDDRLRKLWEKIVEQTWAKEADIRLQVMSLEQSVEDRQYNLWFAAMLDSNIEPTKPERLPKPERRAARRPQDTYETEVLTSSDEDDFIVPDEPGSAMDLDHVLPTSRGATPAKVEVDEASCIGLTPMKRELQPEAETPMFMDLTQVDTPQSRGTAPRSAPVIDLTCTPVKPRILFRPATGKGETGTTPAIGTPPAFMDTPADDDDGFEDFSTIAALPARHWMKLKDRSRLLICILWHLPHTRRSLVFEAVKDHDSQELYALSVGRHMSEPLQDENLLDGGGPEVMPFDMTCLFLSYIKVTRCKAKRIMHLSDDAKKKLTAGQGETWEGFLAFLSRIEPKFPQGSQIYRTDVFDAELNASDDAADDGPPDSQGTPSKSRKNAPKEVVQNKDAVEIRERERRRVEEQEERRLKLRAALNMSGTMSQDETRLIINETKQDDQPLIHINEETGRRIKNHQVDGVRFMWNQIVLDAEVRQGCLLAHTMGLGKTMQVITFLVAIQESVNSANPAVTAQIPEDLRESRTLILCPSGLVDNWMDELLLWAPRGLFGPIRKVEAVLRAPERRQAVLTWADEGGILVSGYNMLKTVTGDDDEVMTALTTKPNIVVADEAHHLKNPSSKIHRVCSLFKTNCRIALTGSPLANNVEEYYSMINWVAPNFLGPLGEFKEIYALPIQQGLWGDSMGWEKRKALKMLQVLKETVAPKVHRKTIKSLKNDLPPKHEFVICVPPTTLQRKLYALYVSGITGEHTSTQKSMKLPRATLFKIVDDLGLLCNHPRCFQQKMIESLQELKKRNGKPGLLPESTITLALKEAKLALDLNNPALSLKTELLTLILDEARKASEKVLIFSQSIPTLNYLTNLLQMQKRRVCRLDGNTAISKRQDMTKSFNAGNQEVYLISTTAGGVGLNIQGASRVVIFDFKWNPVSDQQAIGRAYRIGQDKPVFVYRFIVAGTFEEDLQNKAVFKMQLASRVVDKKNPVSWSKRLGSLLHPVNPSPAKNLDDFVGKDRILDTLIRYKSKGEAILSIVSTDTFEQEDPDKDLTAEELRDADDMIKLNRLRATDPEEYERQRAEEHRRLLSQRIDPTQLYPTQQYPAQQYPAQQYPAQQHPAQQYDQTQTAPGGAVTAPSRAPSAMPRAISRPPEAPVSSSAATPGDAMRRVQQAEAMAARYPRIAAKPDSAQGSSLQTSMAAPLPMAGANTFFGNGAPLGLDLTSAAARAALVPTPAMAAAAGSKLFSLPKTHPGRNNFEQKLRARLDELPGLGSASGVGPPRLTPQETSSAIEQILKDQGFGFLFDNQQWRMLDDHLCDDQFVRAIVSGHLTPSFLARCTKHDLGLRIAALNRLSEKELQKKATATGETADPQNLLNLGRTSSQLMAMAGSHQVREDISVMHDAVLRRQQRSGVLPGR